MAPEHRPIDERVSARLLAERLLDEPNADPDDDLRVLSRQLLRRSEEIANFRSLWAGVMRFTRGWKMHPDGWPVPCECRTCLEHDDG